MNSLLLFILLITIISIVFGCVGSLKIDFVFEIKKYNNPYYNFGISFEEYDAYEEGYIEQVLTIGLFCFNIVFLFYKEEVDFE